MAHSPRSLLGLTLLELMLTVVLFSALMASALGLLRSGMRAQLSWGRVVEPYQQMERAMNRVARDLESAQRFFGVQFVGHQDRIEFASADLVRGLDGQTATDWLRIVYRWDIQGTQAELVREEFLWRTTAHDAEPLHREILMRVMNGRFAFGAQDLQQQFSWTDEWKGKPSELPLLVKADYLLPALAGQLPTSMSRVMRNHVGIIPKQETP